jgi:hypothetical protein
MVEIIKGKNQLNAHGAETDFRTRLPAEQTAWADFGYAFPILLFIEL